MRLLIDKDGSVTALDSAEHEVIHWALMSALSQLRARRAAATLMGIDDRHLKAAERLIAEMTNE